MQKSNLKVKICLQSFFHIIAQQYRNIRRFLKANKLLLGVVFLYFIELFVFYGINGQTCNHYAAYLDDTVFQYSNLFFFIFFQNLKAATIMILQGILPVFLGCLYGATVTVKILVETFKFLLTGVPLHTIILSTLPHGIFERSALLFSIMLSCIISKEITLSLIWLITKRNIIIFGKRRFPMGIKKTALMTAKCWLLIILPLILFAALVESSLSMLVVNLFL